MKKEIISAASKQVIKTSSKSALKAVNPVEFLNQIGSLYSQYLDLKKTEQVEQTNRLKIKSLTEIKLTELEIKRKVFVEYLEKSFDERKENFKILFNKLDDVLKENDVQKIAVLLNGITDLAKTSPFKGLVEIEVAMANKNQEMEL